MEKLEYEDGTLPKHVEAYVRQKLTVKEALDLLEKEDFTQYEPWMYFWARPFTTSSDQ